MFSIRLCLQSYHTLTGCEALDFQRKWGLKETGRVVMNYAPHKFEVVFPVPEAIARLFFRPDKLTYFMSVPLNLLNPGEVVTAEGDDLAIAQTLSTERAVALFVAAKTRALEQRVADLERTLAQRQEEEA